MESQNGFFSNDKNKRTIQNYLGKIEAFQPDNVFEQERNQHIKLILNTMLSFPNQWNKNCSINIDWIGNHFMSILSDNKATSDKETIDNIYAMCFRFLLELYLNTKNDLANEFENARRFATTSFESFAGKAKAQIEYAQKDMPMAILKMLINHDNIDSIKSFNKTAEHAVKMREDWNKELEIKTNEVKQLKENLDKYKAAFNFVGLFQGFDELASEKQDEKASILRYLKMFGTVIILPVLCEIIYIIININKIDQFKTSLVILVIPTISLIGILIYYFRILLMNFNSVKSQLLQLELRKTLCRFIQNYVDYSVEIKKKDKDSLARFESIVFSGLVSNDEKLPSTFDGIEQLTALIKSFKS